MGGKRPFPTYERVTTGVSGYIEIVQVFYNPELLTYAQLLGYFFVLHDPTSQDQQGNDTGTQYRSAIFTSSPQQEQQTKKIIQELDASGEFSDPIVTQVRSAETFYLAEDYHQNYFNDNMGASYCRIVINPKVQKLRSAYSDKLKA